MTPRPFALLLALPTLVGWSFFDPFHENVEKGNRQAEEGDAETALGHYEEASRIDPGSPIPDYNRGIVLSEEGRAEEARDAFLGAAASDDPALAADALYNLGNVHLGAEEYDPAIEAYLKSLDLDPVDEDARRNLEIAFRRKEEQQQQQQQQQQSEESEEPEDPEQQEPQPPDEPQQDDSQDESSPQEEEQDESQEPQPENVPPEERLSREDAERLLNAIQSEELKVLEQMQEQEEGKAAVGNDW